MWIRIKDIKLLVGAAANDEEEREHLLRKICKMLRIEREKIKGISIYRKSPDLRKKSEPLFVYTVDTELVSVPKYANPAFYTPIPGQVNKFEEYIKQIRQKQAAMRCSTRPVIVGFGPAGLFASLILSEAGLCPIILERGRCVEERIKDVNLFWRQNRLNPESNIQFGEGGAGTFSDGKLNSLIREKDTVGRFVLETFVKFGAPKEILYKNKPHIGTDILRKIVKNIRE